MESLCEPTPATRLSSWRGDKVLENFQIADQEVKFISYISNAIWNEAHNVSATQIGQV